MPVFNKQNNNNLKQGNPNARAPFSGASLDPLRPDLGTIKQWNPMNAANRPNPLGPTVDMANGLASFPDKYPAGFNDAYAHLIILAESFLPTLGELGHYGYRKIFRKEMLAKHQGTLTKQFARISGMDTNPQNAALTNLATSWNPGMNEVTIKATAKLATTNAWGRHYKTNSFAEAINVIDWKLQMAEKFANNAAETLNNLAGMRMWEGANKLFVSALTAFDPAKPLAPRITLGADASTVTAPLSLDALLEAKYQMQNYKEIFINVKVDGSLEEKTRKRVITGWNGGAYLVLLGASGYHQVLSDERFRESFIVNGGVAAQGILDETVGINSSIFGLKFEILNNPLTISKEAKPKLSTDGEFDLEVAYVLGGGIDTVGVELSLDGYTKMIDVPYNDSRKVDPFELLSITGWMAVTDFTILQNEALYAIPYDRNATLITAGNIVNPLNATWKA